MGPELVQAQAPPSVARAPAPDADAAPTSPAPLRTTDPARPTAWVGSATDRSERDADLAADRALARLRPTVDPGAETDLHRHDPSCGHLRRAPAPSPSGIGTAGGALPSASAEAIERLRGGGRPIESVVRRRMEEGFGTTFSGVRIHDGAAASQLSRSMSARAFTTGQDVFFRAGEYAPGTPAGDRVLAHELAHTLQPDQGGARRLLDAPDCHPLTIRRGSWFSSPVVEEDEEEAEPPSVKTIGGAVRTIEEVARHVRTGWTGTYTLLANGAFPDEPDVQRLLTWLGTATEGTAGIPNTERTPTDFDGAATAASTEGDALTGVALHDDNRLFVTVRTFQAPNYEAAALRARTDLETVTAHVSTSGFRDRLAEQGWIGPDSNLTAVRASPSEMHPGTLPTVKLSFGEATLFFKGRSKSVEEGLVGTGTGAVTRLGGDTSGVGTHGFVGLDVGDGHDNAHVAQNVGLAPDVDAESPAAAWVSATKTAIALLMSAMTDTHLSNFIDGSSGKRHLIDGEFMLNPSVLKAINDFREDPERAFPFEIDKTVPSRLSARTAELEPLAKTALAEQVVLACDGLWADEARQLVAFEARLREVVEADVLLRTFMGGTDVWLGFLPTVHERKREGGDAEVLAFFRDNVYPAMKTDYDRYFTYSEDPLPAAEELQRTMLAGGVPVFHIKARTGTLMVNKTVPIGDVREAYRAGTVLTEASRFVRESKARILAAVSARIQR